MMKAIRACVMFAVALVISCTSGPSGHRAASGPSPVPSDGKTSGAVHARADAPASAEPPVTVAVSELRLASGCVAHVALRNNTAEELRVSEFQLMSALLFLELRLEGQSFGLRRDPSLEVCPAPLETDFARIAPGEEVSLEIGLPALGLEPTPPPGPRVMRARLEGSVTCTDADLGNMRQLPFRFDGPVEVRDR